MNTKDTQKKSRNLTFVWMIILISLILLLNACHANDVFIDGSGILVSDSRPVSNFDYVSLESHAKLIVIQGAEESLTIETDDNIIPHVVSEVRGKTLHLYADNKFGQWLSPTQLTFILHANTLVGMRNKGSGLISADSLTTESLEIKIRGSGNIQIDSLSAQHVTADIDGSGDAIVSGKLTSQDISIHGSGSYYGGNLQSETAMIAINASGSVTVWVDSTLSVDINKSGSVQYYGKPDIHSSISGSGNIINLGNR